MKSIFLALAISLCAGMSHAYTNVNLAKSQGFSSAVSVSTTPAVFTSSSTLLELERVEIWNYSADVMYLNFTLPTSSTTAAATGIKVFQSSENNESIVLDIAEGTPLYLTLAADSGTGALRILELGRQKR